MAVAPTRSADGVTRLLINSHQPYTGPLAWYEVRLNSDEGWDMAGGVFPGSPFILHGFGPKLGWANTVNTPDLTDVYVLTDQSATIRTNTNSTARWRDFERSRREITVAHRSAPVTIRVTRDVLTPSTGR